MRVRSSWDLWRQSEINRYLVCAVVSKQARRLGRLIPEMRVRELIGVALRNCAQHRLEVQIDSNTPEVIREEAAHMFSTVERSGASSGAATSAGSQVGNGASNLRQQTGDENIPGEKGAALSTTQLDSHISIGADIDSPDSCSNLHGLPRKYSMSNANGTDRVRQLQLRAFAENLYLLANRHRENGNYLIAHALYGRALEAARSVDTPEHKQNGSVLVARIQKDQQAVFEKLRLNEGNWEGGLLGKGQKAGP